MSSSYPVPGPPASSGAAGAAGAAPTTPLTQPTLSPRQQPPHHHQFDNGAALSSAFADSAAADAAAAAHQGLRALQAAPAVPGHAPLQSPVAHQYPPPLHSPHSDQHYSPGTPIPLAQQPHKVTRLRRACDMCSQRKVKVSSTRVAPSVARHCDVASLADQLLAVRRVRPALSSV